jgi:enhancer of polycomb-like protein
MTQRQTGARFRQRKLSTKQNLPVLREHEVEKLVDDDASRHIPKVETGVEKGEEIVSPFHLRYAASGIIPLSRLFVVPSTRKPKQKP